jgi:hypothetical protein
VIELLRDDPELLAIADAVAATQTRLSDAADDADRGEEGENAETGER